MLVHRHWLLTPERAAVYLPSATAVIADLHLGYVQARRRRGEAIPDGGLEDTLGLLGALMSRCKVRRLVIAGDLVEDRTGVALIPDLLAWLRPRGVELAGIVPGNHDRGLAALPLPLHPHGLLLGGWRVVHGDAPAADTPHVQGHHHPCLRWGRLSAPCYLVGKDCLVLPAFSVDAAGGNVLDDPRWGRCRCGVPSADRVLDFGLVSQLRRWLRAPGARPVPSAFTPSVQRAAGPRILPDSRATSKARQRRSRDSVSPSGPAPGCPGPRPS
jgi:metallophosphoesterase superfamily enzyme